MRKRIARAWTVNSAPAGTPSKVYVRKMRGTFAKAYTVNEAGKRGLHNPPAQ
jgi:hypothetical protein